MILLIDTQRKYTYPARTAFVQSHLDVGIRIKKAGFLLAKHKTLF